MMNNFDSHNKATIDRIIQAEMDKRQMPAQIQAQKQLNATEFTLKEAQQIALLIEEEASRIRLPIVFSAVDAHGRQLLYFRMDGALLISEQLAYDKAYTAAALRMPTHELTYQMRPGAELYSLESKPHVTCVGGGFPYWKQMQLIGGLGVSGGTVEQDMQIVRRALKAHQK